MSAEPIKVFFSYSHRDEEFKDELVSHLSILQRQGVIDGWHDRLISPGSEWDREIDTYLNSADIILLMISADFLASNYCWGVEVKRALERHETGEACVIPIVVRAVNWKNTPIAKLQALPKNAKPIRSWADRDEAFTNVSEGIEKIVNLLRERRKKEAEKIQTDKKAQQTETINAKSPQISTESSRNSLAKDFYAIALEKYKQEDYRGAIADYDQAITLQPDFANAYFNRGIALISTLLTKEAVAEFVKKHSYASASFAMLASTPLAFSTVPIWGPLVMGVSSYRNYHVKQRAIADFQQAADLYQQQGKTEEYQNTLNILSEIQSKMQMK